MLLQNSIKNFRSEILFFIRKLNFSKISGSKLDLFSNGSVE